MRLTVQTTATDGIFCVETFGEAVLLGEINVVKPALFLYTTSNLSPAWQGAKRTPAQQRPNE